MKPSNECATTSKIAWVLMFALVATRIPWVERLACLDATLAAFFLGGLFRLRLRHLGGLLVSAIGADLIAFRLGMAEPACLSPAYLFLVPTYAIVWWAGVCSGSPARNRTLWLGRAVLLSAGATVTAFVVSNLAYYVWAVQDPALGLLDYFDTIGRYFPVYALGMFLYVPLVLAVAMLRQMRRESVPFAFCVGQSSSERGSL